MLRKEWPLIMSSLLAQLAAGMFIILVTTRMIILNSNGQELALQLTRLGITQVGPIIALGIGLSLFHLGNPLRAYRSVVKIGKSWLSWEVFFSVIFFILWLVCFLLDEMGMANQYLLASTGLAGVLNVFSMAAIYFKTGKLGWARIETFLSFFGSLIILGTLSSVLVFGYTMVDPAATASIWLRLTILSIFVLALELISFILFLPKLRLIDTEGTLDQLVSSTTLNQDTIKFYRFFKIGGWLLSFLGVTLLFVYLNGGQAVTYMVPISFILAFSGELLGRCAFFTLGFGD